ncbi:MAG: phosphoribosylglycinamide formyltransferase [Phycisphaerales bacterium]
MHDPESKPVPDLAVKPAARLAVLLSGSGRTLDNLLASIAQGTLDASIAIVVGSRACLGIDKAQAAGIPTLVCDGGIKSDELDKLCDQYSIDWVILAGYLKLVPITDRVRGRVINIHPALLPDFGGPGMHGMRVHRAVLEAAHRGEVSETGCTVHFADEEYDQGQIIEQRRCPVDPSDTAQQIADRVFELECACLPSAITKAMGS